MNTELCLCPCCVKRRNIEVQPDSLERLADGDGRRFRHMRVTLTGSLTEPPKAEHEQ